MPPDQDGFTKEFLLVSILENLPGFAWVKDKQGRILLAKQSVTKVHGLGAVFQIQGLTDFDLFPKELAEKYWADDQRVMNEDASITCEEETLVNGVLIWQETFKAPLHGPNGTVIGTVGFSRDITERKLSQLRVDRLTQLYEALWWCNYATIHSKSTEELLAQLCRNLVFHGGMKFAGIGAINEQEKKIRFEISDGYQACLPDQSGFSPDDHEVIATLCFDQVIQDNQPLWIQDVQNDPLVSHWKEWVNDHSVGSIALIPLTQRGKTTRVLCLQSEHAESFDADQRRLLMKMVHLADFAIEAFLTEKERLAMIKNLAESQGKLQGALSSATDAVFISDESGNLIEFNEEFAIFHRFKNKEECRGKLSDYPELFEAFMEDGKLAPVEMWAVPRALRGETCHHEEYTIRRTDTGETWVGSYSFGPIRDENGKIVGAIVGARDITKRKEEEILMKEQSEKLRLTNLELLETLQRTEELADKAEAAARSKTEFLATMSHELRTPLHGVLGIAELLSLTELTEEQKEYSKIIARSGQHLLEVVNDILDFSSIDKGTMMLESDSIQVAELIESTLLTIRKAAEEKGLKVLSEISPTVPSVITGDERRIRQILINLIGNAVKFTEVGFIRVKVDTRLVEGKLLLTVSVGDSGPGIEPEILSKLFKPFTQGDSTLHRRFEGTGLGLAIVKRLSSIMGGTITVNSTPGKGSVFTFSLPLACAASQTEVEVTGSTPEKTVTDSNQLILVVDDDKISRTIAGLLLNQLGFSVDFALNGAEAVAAYEPGKYATILMDMQMPVMDGIEATRKIRQIEPSKGGGVPILALTANVLPEDRQRCLEAGMTDVLTKPYKKEKLAEKLSYLLQES